MDWQANRIKDCTAAEESCVALGNPPQAENPAWQDSFLLRNFGVVGAPEKIINGDMVVIT